MTCPPPEIIRLKSQTRTSNPGLVGQQTKWCRDPSIVCVRRAFKTRITWPSCSCSNENKGCTVLLSQWQTPADREVSASLRLTWSIFDVRTVLLFLPYLFQLTVNTHSSRSTINKLCGRCNVMSRYRSDTTLKIIRHKNCRFCWVWRCVSELTHFLDYNTLRFGETFSRRLQALTALTTSWLLTL
jgi:hypothetical protein